MKKCLVSFFLFFFVVSAAQAYLSIPMDLGQMANQAGLIFRGSLESQRQETLVQPKTGKKIPVAVSVFRIEEVLKGEAGSRVEVRQLGVHSLREAMQLGFAGFNGAVRFDTGKTYLIFLSAQNASGLRSLVGATEGRFEIQKNARGEETVVNPHAPRGMLEGGDVKSAGKGVPAGPISYDAFTEKVKKALIK